MSDLDAIRDRIAEAGLETFGDDWRPVLESIAPGRIELIGGHLDYNGGPVLAAAIDKMIVVRASSNGTSAVRALFPDIDPTVLHTIDPTELNEWRIDTGAQSPADFLRGVMAALLGRGLPLRIGLDLIVSGNLPHGVGISSSAALCVALVQMLSEEPLTKRDLVLIAQESENRTGSPCGTMDQSASVYGQIIRFDGATTESTQLHADLTGWMFVVANSGVVRSLATSVYPDRVRESKEALTILRDRYQSDLASLSALPSSDLARALVILADRPDLQGRVKHIVNETDRVQACAVAVSERDWMTFGREMTAGGKSSSLDYGIGHPVVTDLTTAALDQAAVAGARIMGGGEGGAALLLVNAREWPDVRKHLDDSFYRTRGYDVDTMLIPCTFSPGTSITELS